MHPPDFTITHRLSDWPDCRLEVICGACSGRKVMLPVRLLLHERGDKPFTEVVAGLRCSACAGRPDEDRVHGAATELGGGAGAAASGVGTRLAEGKRPRAVWHGAVRDQSPLRRDQIKL